MTLDLPDVPRWVEAHGIAADQAHWRLDFDRGYALGHDGARLVVVIGEPSLPDLPTTHSIIAATPFPRATRAIIHTLDGEPPEHEGGVLLPSDAPLPDYLAAELAWAQSRGPVYACYLDGRPAAFAYAPWRSGKYFDVSVDVVPDARQLGLGTIVASALIHAEKPRLPVWGADEHNAASLRLAKNLGFTPVDELWVAPPS